MIRTRYLPDEFTICLVCTVLPASLFSVGGTTAHMFEWFTDDAVTLLFFLHLMKLFVEAVLGPASRGDAQLKPWS